MIRRVKSWLQPSVGQPHSSPNLHRYKNPGLSLQKWSASTLPLNHEMAPQGLRILFQPLPFPNGCKSQPSDVCTGVLLWWRFAVSPIHIRVILDLCWRSWGHLYSSVGFSLCTSSCHLCAQSPTGLQAIPRTNSLASIFSRSHCHCLDWRQSNIFLMFFPNPKRRGKKRQTLFST